MGPWKGKRIDRVALEARRMQAAQWFAQGLSQGEVARRLGVSTAAVCQWYHAWQQGGVEALRRQPSGRQPQLGQAQLAALKAALIAGPQAAGWSTNLWTLARIRELIWRRFGVRFSIGYVWKILVRLGMSPQRPQPRARERDEAAIAWWRDRHWPAKKGAQPGGASGSCTSMKAASRSGPACVAPGRPEA
jgi:transposase